MRLELGLEDLLPGHQKGIALRSGAPLLPAGLELGPRGSRSRAGGRGYDYERRRGRSTLLAVRARLPKSLRLRSVNATRRGRGGDATSVTEASRRDQRVYVLKSLLINYCTFLSASQIDSCTRI